MRNYIIIFLAAVIIGAGAHYFWTNRGQERENGAPAENPAEDLGNSLEKQDLIRLASPRPNDIVKSPLLIEGEARGNWYFEASFPVSLYDGKGKLLARAPAEAQSDWMTTDFVQFKVGLKFNAPETETGFLVLEKDNPSGLPENADELRIPVKFR
jgi:hypothetical protein